MARTDKIASELIAAILTPYREVCRYLQGAGVELAESSEPGGALVIGHGEFAIGESWYIQDTGHFNAVEANICYNQLGYAVIGHTVERGLIPAMRELDFPSYRERQLSSVLIADYACRFDRPINPRAFSGTFSIESVEPRSRFYLMHTRCAFFDGGGGRAGGKVVLAILKPEAAAHEPR